MGRMKRKPRKKTPYVNHQPEILGMAETIKMYWSLKGTLPDREVYLMTETARQESLALAKSSGEFYTGRPETHGLSKFTNTAPEKLLTMLSPTEVATCDEILELLDIHYRDEMTGMERFYHAVQYVKWQRWLIYSFEMDFSDFQKSDLALEQQFHKKQTDFYNRLHELRREKVKIQEDVIDFVVETIPESEAVVEKVKYVEKAKVVETGTPEGPVGTD